MGWILLQISDSAVKGKPAEQQDSQTAYKWNVMLYSTFQSVSQENPVQYKEQGDGQGCPETDVVGAGSGCGLIKVNQDKSVKKQQDCHKKKEKVFFHM